MEALVSILVPAYNAEKWIADTLRSAINQTWQRKEIILVDDGSTDKTLAIARQFSSESVRVVTQVNGGASAARNKAFSLCKGDYIQWLDADDLLAPDKIATQMASIGPAEERTLLSASFGNFMYRSSKARFTPSPLWADLSATEFLIHKLGGKVFMANCAWLVSRTLTTIAGPWDETLSMDDDGEYFCRVLLASHGIRFVREAKAFYRSVGTTSLSWAMESNTKLDDLWRSMQMHIRYVRSLEESERVRTACITYLQNYVIDFYPKRLDIFQEMALKAKELGGDLALPKLSQKYAWIRPIFGWSKAQRAQMWVPNVKWSLLRGWDKTLLNLEKYRAS